MVTYANPVWKAGAGMDQYIITEDQLQAISWALGKQFNGNQLFREVRSHPIQKTREIPLTKGKVALVDDGDYESLNKHKWTALKNYNTFYAKRESGGKTIYMHRVILGTQPGFETDHIDGNGLNNQKYNLRFVSVRENGQNRHQEKTSRFPGVSKFRNKWKSQCLIGKERIYLGLFDTEEEAFAAYKKTVDNVESPYQSERDKMLDEKLASQYKTILMQCMDGMEEIRSKYSIAPKSCKSCSAYDLCEELQQAGSP